MATTTLMTLSKPSAATAWCRLAVAMVAKWSQTVDANMVAQVRCWHWVTSELNIPKMHNTKQTLGVVAFTQATIAKSEDVSEDVATKESGLSLKYLLTNQVWCCMLVAR
jgi:hypothetical protein